MCCRWVCGYSMTSKPRLKLFPPDTTFAAIGYAPGVMVAGGVTVNLIVVDSSGRPKLTFAVAGSRRQLAGASSDTSASAVPGVLLVTVTVISRERSLPAFADVRIGPGAAAGRIAMSGVR